MRACEKKSLKRILSFEISVMMDASVVVLHGLLTFCFADASAGAIDVFLKMCYQQ